MGGGIHNAFPVNLAIVKKGPDFYVGGNGKALLGKYKHWIGVSQREKLLGKVKNEKLKNAIDQIYRPGSFVGDGGTASVLKFEKRTGINVGRNGNSHMKKASDMAKYLNKKVLCQDLTSKERKIANKLLKKLRLAIYESKGE